MQYELSANWVINTKQIIHAEIVNLCMHIAYSEAKKQ